MKTDNKEEAKRFWKSEFNNYDFSSWIGYTKFLSDFHNHMKDQHRFHPETFERVVKPVKVLTGENIWNYDEALKEHENALTLDQLIERCKEMHNSLQAIADKTFNKK